MLAISAPFPHLNDSLTRSFTDTYPIEHRSLGIPSFTLATFGVYRFAFCQTCPFWESPQTHCTGFLSPLLQLQLPILYSPPRPCPTTHITPVAIPRPMSYYSRWTATHMTLSLSNPTWNRSLIPLTRTTICLNVTPARAYTGINTCSPCD